MIEFNNVSFRYDSEQQAGSIDKISLRIKKGECVLLCGPSGCGKTTAIRMINGLIPHFYEGEIQGKIRIASKDVVEEELYSIAQVVGTVFQNPRSQFFNVDTTSELPFGCENMGMPEEEIKERMQSVIEQAGISKLMDRNIFKLSGGEKQKIACASVMTSSPDIIVLDEPSANLDYDAIVDLQKMLAIWKKEGKTIVIAEHRLAYCLDYVDRIIIMDKGRIVQDVSRNQFQTYRDEELHSRGLRSAKNIDARTISKSPHTREYMTIRNLCFGYEKSSPVLDFAQMDIPLNEVVAIVGANGVGKTTFLRCLCGMEKRCKAVLEYRGKLYKNKQRMKLMYLVMQDVNHQLFTESVLEEVMISMEEEKETEAIEILEELDLSNLKDRHPISLSGGQKQRVAVASAIASKREIVLFDEPTSGLDYRHMMQVGSMLNKLKETGKTVLVVTHDAELVESCCTSVISLERRR